MTTWTPAELGLDLRDGVEPGAVEPVLYDADVQAWEAYGELALRHAATGDHRERVRQAQNHIRAMMGQCPDAYLTWSAGKDSTALVHLVLVVAQEQGHPYPRILAIKDDCDYPGEEAYLRHWAKAWGVEDRLDIRRPAESLQQWLALGGDMRDPSDELHARGTPFSDQNFYNIIAAYDQERGCPGVYLGLRAMESKHRKLNLATRGEIYTKRTSQTVCQPIARWSGLDLFAYLFSRGIHPLHVYRCCGGGDPSMVRKSWWLPGRHAARGAGVALRRHYPSLFARLCEIMPHASRLK
jgi:3'-phosphoadenosine 5'-phosphosulfate sulfotransferase (PAPS reductase)/FAD synthetase